MADSAVIGKIFADYNEMRNNAAFERSKRIENVYAAAPRIKEIDNEMNRLGAENVKKIIKNPEKSDELNNEYKKRIKELEAEKSKILKEKGIDENYKEYRYNCEMCSDTGHTPDGKRCSCLIRKLIEANYSASNLGERLEKENFDNFSFDYYSKQPWNNGASPYENMQRVYRRARKFCDNFDSDFKNMLFYGAPGLGKTFLSSCIAKELIEKGKTVIYIRASKLFTIMNDERFGRNTDSDAVKDLYGCDLLIIDDLGTEAVMKNNNSYLFDVVDERLINKKSMIISTNIDISEITRIYTSRFTSRIMESFIVCKFYGDDIRMKI